MKPFLVLIFSIFIFSCSKNATSPADNTVNVTCTVGSEYKNRDIYTFYFTTNCKLSKPIDELCIVGYRWYVQDNNHQIVDSVFWSTTIPKGVTNQGTTTDIKTDRNFASFKIVSVQTVSNKYKFIY